MAKLSAIAILLVFLSISSTTLVSLCQGSLVIDEKKPAPKLPEPMETHIKVYWHENFTGPDPTSIVIAEAPSTNSSATQFGRTYTFDNPLTVDPDSMDDVVGRVQGIYTFSSKETMSLTLTMTMVFTEGRYNGSTLLVYGRVKVDNMQKEIPVVGGSGVFKLATGYSLVQRTYFDTTTFNNVIEYDLHVRHYY